MEVFPGVSGWVEVFGGVSGWTEVFRMFWAGRSSFGLVPIGDFDITRRYATRREMSRNVEFCQSRYWGRTSLSSFVGLSRIIHQNGHKSLSNRFFMITQQAIVPPA